MNPPSNPLPAWLPLIFVMFPICFVALWCFVNWMLAQLGGWARLAEKYPGSPTPTGTKFCGQSGRVGYARYNGILTIHTSPEGLHVAVMILFRIGHPPMLIPWTEIHGATMRRFLFWKTVDFEIGSPAVGRMQLPEKVFAGQPVPTDGLWPTLAPRNTLGG